MKIIAFMPTEDTHRLCRFVLTQDFGLHEHEDFCLTYFPSNDWERHIKPDTSQLLIIGSYHPSYPLVEWVGAAKRINSKIVVMNFSFLPDSDVFDGHIELTLQAAPENLRAAIRKFLNQA